MSDRSPTLEAYIACRDAVELATRVHFPVGRPRALLIGRTPYGRESHRYEAAYWTSMGDIFVSQDVRGRGDSLGAWQPFESERRDGADTVAWLNAQSWADGLPKISIGSSYDAFCALEVARGNPHLVRGVITRVPVTSRRSVTFSPEGILHLSGRIAWARAQLQAGGGSTVQRLAPEDAAAETLPLTALATSMATTEEQWLHALGMSLPPVPCSEPDVAVPGLHIGGWFDPFAHDTLAFARAPLAGRQTVVLGPWTHDLQPAGRVGQLSIKRPRDINLPAIESDWVRDIAAHDETVIGSSAIGGVRFYVLGRDEWRTAQSWPPTEVQVRKFALGDKGSSKPGVLTSARPGSQGTAVTLNPAEPAPDLLGPVDQSPFIERTDTSSFVSMPLTRSLEIAGDVSVRLWIRGDTPSADIVARLTWVTGAGVALNITHAIMPVVMTNEWQPVDIKMRPVAVRLGVGDSLRMDITGSCFPYYARNPNSGEDRRTASHLTVSTIQISWAASRVSYVNVPVLSED